MTAFSRQAWIRPGRPPYLLLLCGLGTGAAIAARARRGAGARSAPLPSRASQTADPSGLRVTGVPWVVLPTFNEAENLERIVAAVVSALEQAAPDGFRVLIVDDDSPDGTGAIADTLAAEHAGIEVLHRSEREGLGPAYIAGFRRALAQGAGYVLEMDADGSHDPRDLARLLAAVRGGSADLALGSRYATGGKISNWSILRRATSKAGCWYARKVLRLEVGDLTGGFKCFAAEVLEAVDLASLPGTMRRLPRARGSNHLPGPRARLLEDELADRGRGGMARPTTAARRRSCAPESRQRPPPASRPRRLIAAWQRGTPTSLLGPRLHLRARTSRSPCTAD